LLRKDELINIFKWGFKYVIENGGLGEMMVVDRTGGGQLVCVISPQMPREVIS